VINSTELRQVKVVMWVKLEEGCEIETRWVHEHAAISSPGWHRVPTKTKKVYKDI